jgi:hypothetical protein
LEGNLPTSSEADPDRSKWKNPSTRGLSSSSSFFELDGQIKTSATNINNDMTTHLEFCLTNARTK